MLAVMVSFMRGSRRVVRRDGDEVSGRGVARRMGRWER